MKRFLLFAVAAFMFVGCNNAFEDKGNSRLTLSELPTLTAGFEDADTRTYVENNKFLRWHEGDLLTAFYGNSLNRQYRFNGATGANSGTFSHVPSGELETGNLFDRIYAIYPYDADATITDDGIISYSVPAVQNYAEASFGKDANTMVAVTENIEDTFLGFKNLCGFLKIKLYGEGVVKSLELKGNDGEKIAGQATITATFDSEPEVVMADDAAESITLDCGEGVALSADAENPTEFWVVVPPTTFESGITITVTNTDGGVFEQTTTNAVAIERNEIQPMTAVEVLEFEIAKPANNEIWYKSTDGNIVTPYRSNVFGATIVSNTYEDGKGVITFDGAVTTIGDYAFGECYSLTSVTIPDSVTAIGDYAFGWCENLTSVTIGDSVTTIEGYAFYDCYGLTSVTIPDSVTTIGAGAFSDCDSLTSVTIPDSVTTIGVGAFAYCDSLKEFKGKYATDNGRCLVIDNTLIAYAYASGTEYTIPNSVTTIGNSAFSGCYSLTSVTIPDSVTTIGDSAFSSCRSLTSVTIGDSVTTIGNSAFRYCSSLTSITIPDSVTIIGYEVFNECINLKEFSGKYASNDGRCLIVDGELNSFAPAGLSEYTIPDSVTAIGEFAFYHCNSLTSITIPNSVTTIGEYAFCGCYGLTSVTIGDSVTTIEGYAFYDCYGLTSVTIGDSVTTIGEYAFSYCLNLSSVYCEAITPPIMVGDMVFFENAYNRKIYVSTELVDAYKTTEGWSKYADDIVSVDWGALDAPNVEISHQDDTTITLSWDAIEGASEYILSIEDSIYDPYTTTETSYTFELTDAGYYCISVQAVDDQDNASFPVSIEFVMGDPNSADWFTQKLMTTAEIEEQGMDASSILLFTWKGENIVDCKYGVFETNTIIGIEDSEIIQYMYSANEYLENINSADGLTAHIVGMNQNTSYTMFVYVVNDKGAKLLVREERTTAELVRSEYYERWLGVWSVNSHQICTFADNRNASLSDGEEYFDVVISEYNLNGNPDCVLITGFSSHGYPALGHVDGNTLTIMNGVSVAIDGDYYYLWLTFSPDYGFISDERYSYTLTMDESGNVSCSNFIDEIGEEVYCADVFVMNGNTGEVFLLNDVWSYRGGSMDWTKSEATPSALGLKSTVKPAFEMLPPSLVVAE